MSSRRGSVLIILRMMMMMIVVLLVLIKQMVITVTRAVTFVINVPDRIITDRHHIHGGT